MTVDVSVLRRQTAPFFAQQNLKLLAFLYFLLSKRSSCSRGVRWSYKLIWLTSKSSWKPYCDASRFSNLLRAAITFPFASLRVNLQTIAFGLFEAERLGIRWAISMSLSETSSTPRASNSLRQRATVWSEVSFCVVAGIPTILTLNW